MRQVSEQILDILRSNGKTLTCAESCTGGMISSAITAVPGSSDVFYGGFVTYTNDAKMKMLSVSSDILASYGAVSAECAEEMALGAANSANADYSVSVTGFAGPTGDDVGLVFIGVSDGVNAYSQRYIFAGDRGQVRSQAAIAALGLLLAYLKRGYINEK